MKQLFTGMITMAFILTITHTHAQEGPFTLAPLPYAFNALEPAIDAQTMEIHYSKHHAAYVKNLNAALKGTDFASWTLDELMLYASETTDAIRNNAGGHYNHTLFWNILGLNHPFDPNSAVGKAVIETFGSVDSLNRSLSKAGASRFGSGWAWLILTPDRKLAVCSSPNQDNPIMDVMEERGIPILGIDVWEHAYYLKYQNKRGDYLSAVLGAVNWQAVDKNYREALSSELMKTLERETWTELHEFHIVMSQTFHPSEEGNLEPIRRRSQEMADKAVVLQKGRIPQSFDNPEIKKAIADLVSGSAELNRMVAERGSDKAITSKLNSLHDTFHLIQGLCRH
jgi:superoxide dismutase